MFFSDYLSNIICKYFFLGENPPSPFLNKTNLYMGLQTNAVGSGPPTEPAGNGYARVPIVLSWYAQDRYLHQANNPIYFPRASGGGWGTIYGGLLYDASPVGTGNLFYWVNWEDVSGVPIDSFTISGGQRLYFPVWRMFVALRGKHFYPDYFNVENGGVSDEYCGVILKWVQNIEAVPHARTYNMAIGRNAAFDARGNLSNYYWAECSGDGYSRQPINASDWTQYPYGVIKNNKEIIFTNGAQSDWGNITDVLLYPSDAPNNPAFWGHLDTAITVNENDAFSITENRLTITIGTRNVI